MTSNEDNRPAFRGGLTELIRMPTKTFDRNKPVAALSRGRSARTISQQMRQMLRSGGEDDLDAEEDTSVLSEASSSPKQEHEEFQSSVQKVANKSEERLGLMSIFGRQSVSPHDACQDALSAESVVDNASDPEPRPGTHDAKRPTMAVGVIHSGETTHLSESSGDPSLTENSANVEGTAKEPNDSNLTLFFHSMVCEAYRLSCEGLDKECHDLCLELIYKNASIPRAYQCELLQILSGVVPYKDAKKYLQDALKLCDEMEDKDIGDGLRKKAYLLQVQLEEDQTGKDINE